MSHMSHRRQKLPPTEKPLICSWRQRCKFQHSNFLSVRSWANYLHIRHQSPHLHKGHKAALIITLLPHKTVGRVRQLVHAELSEHHLEQSKGERRVCCGCCLLDSPPIITKPDADSSLWLQTLWIQFAHFYKSWYLSPLVLSLYYLRAREVSSIWNVFPWSSKETWRKKAEKGVNWVPKESTYGVSIFVSEKFYSVFLGGMHINSPYKGRSHTGSFWPSPPHPCVPMVCLYVYQCLMRVHTHTHTHTREAGRADLDISSALANPQLI